MWVAMTLRKWDGAFEMLNNRLPCHIDWPESVGFLVVFKEKADALAFAGEGGGVSQISMKEGMK